MNARTALVTGASSGIGLELARVFARHGHALVLVARSTEKLVQLSQELASDFGVAVEVITADLSQPGAAQFIADEAGRRGLTVDILVNNAGFGLSGRYAELDLQRQLEMIQTNVTALSALTGLFLPGMIERNSGGVLNVASTAAFQAGPGMATYYATKAFVLSLSEALHEEVAGTNLHVTCLCPGPTATGFFGAANMEGARLLKFGTHSAAAVAQIGYAAFVKNRAIAIPGIKNNLLAIGTKLGPRAISRKLAMVLNR
jgi:short-subunit dehydrogenase